MNDKEKKERKRIWNKEWIKNNRERYNSSKYLYRERVKEEVIRYYSKGEMKCAICGFDNIDGLCIDHINNDGAEHRKKYHISGRNSAGTNTYEVLKREKFPDGMQVLCANCNLIKEMERKRKERLKNPFYSKRYHKGGGLHL